MSEALIYRIALVVIVLPTAWSFIVTLLRVGLEWNASSIQPIDGVEKILLTLMIIPYFIGITAILTGIYGFQSLPDLPSFIPPLPEYMSYDLQQGFASNKTQNTNVQINIATIFLASGVIYGVGLCIGMVHLCRAWIYLRYTNRNSLHKQITSGVSVNITDEVISPYVNVKGHVIFSKALLGLLSNTDLELILHHERAHVDRGDPLYFWCLALVDVVFWFNPAIRHQNRRCRLSAELACDRATLKAFPGRHKDYARTMLTTVKFMKAHKPVSATICVPTLILFTPKGEFTMRLHQIIQFDEHTYSRKLGKKSVLAVCALSLCAVPLFLSQYSFAGYAHATVPDDEVGEQVDFNAFKGSFNITVINFTKSPLDGRISSHYGERIHPITKKPVFHHGVDIVADTGSKIVAPAPGTVLRVRENYKGYGNLLEIEHSQGFITRYGQLSAFDVEEGDRVAAGQTIARVGESGQATGPHLHLELWKNNKSLNPISLIPITDLKKK